jgi:hypothetical protein
MSLLRPYYLAGMYVCICNSKVLRCDVCDVAVTTDANYELHINGELHQKNLQTV